MAVKIAKEIPNDLYIELIEEDGKIKLRHNGFVFIVLETSQTGNHTLKVLNRTRPGGGTLELERNIEALTC